MRDGGADRRQPEPLGHGGDDRHRPIRRDRERPVHAVAPRDVLHRVDVGEVDDLGYVGQRQARSRRVAVDRDDPEPALARLHDRAALVASRADEEHARHGAMLDERPAALWAGLVWSDAACPAARLVAHPTVERWTRRRHEVVSHPTVLSN